jgi:uncharacterized protein (TIGR00297 family)
MTAALFVRLGVGLAISAGIGAAAYRRAALTRSGIAGAVLTGTVIFGFGGWIWGALLITFFVAASLLSAYKAGVKATLAEKFAKGSRRDLAQALANGGAGALIALAHAIAPHPAGFFAFVGAMATVNADTWATELGVLSRRPPRLITTGRPVAPGTSGGISRLGTLATLAGGAVIGAVAALLRRLAGEGRDALALVVAATLGGLAGSLFDSLLGATVQALYAAPARPDQTTEKPIARDGTPHRHVRGWRWLNNDWVNFLSSLVGAAVSALVALGVGAGS